MQKRSCLQDVVVIDSTGKKQKAKRRQRLIDASDELGKDVLPVDWLELEDGGRVDKLHTGIWQHEDSGEIYQIIEQIASP